MIHVSRANMTLLCYYQYWSNFLIFFAFVESNRDELDWSGRKPLDYRKQSTKLVSASTFSSKYGKSNKYNCTSSNRSIDISETHGNNLATFKIKRNKQCSTTNATIVRSHSMNESFKSPLLNNSEPMQDTHFSPEIDGDRRNRSYYHSILFRKKSNPSSKSSVVSKWYLGTIYVSY